MGWGMVPNMEAGSSHLRTMQEVLQGTTSKGENAKEGGISGGKKDDGKGAETIKKTIEKVD